MKFSRRAFTKSATVATMSFGIAPRIAKAQTTNPHFFLYIWYGPGADASYLFDARPLEMTAKGKIQNYRGEEPEIYTGSNGNQALITSLASPLKPYFDRFSLLNGVHMSTTDDGHSQNISYLLTGNPLLSGPSLLAELKSPKASMDFLQIGIQSDIDKVSFTNAPAGLAIDLQAAASLSEALSQQNQGAAGTEALKRRQAADQFIQAQAGKMNKGNGLFSRGARDFVSGFGGSGALAKKLAEVKIDTSLGDGIASASLAHQYFKHGIAESAMIIYNKEDFDAHSFGQASEQPATFAGLVDFLAGIFKYLKETAFDETAGLSLLDVTTVLCGPEFSRTMRQEDKAIDETGTDHNALCNSLLIGGKGIKGGLVVGKSDLDKLGNDGEFTGVSEAHLLLDPKLVKAMGRPFDPSTMSVLDVAPQTFNRSEYLSINMVVNTIHELFGSPESVRRKFAQNEPVTPFIRGLLV